MDGTIAAERAPRKYVVTRQRVTGEAVSTIREFPPSSPEQLPDLNEEAMFATRAQCECDGRDHRYSWKFLLF